MKDIEPFDDWVRGEIHSLDNPPENFRREAVWQKLQTKLHPKRQNSIRIQGIKSIFRVAVAAIVLLLLAGGVWWQSQNKTTEIANLNRVLNPVKVKKLESTVKLTEKSSIIEPLQEIANLNKIQNPIKVEGTIQLTEKMQIIEPPQQETQEFVKVEKEVKKVEMINTGVSEAPIENLAEVPIKVSNLVKVEKVVKVEKAKFKIIHINELTDYQRTEVAKTKEIQANKFVVINWKSDSPSQSESSLMSYIRKKAE